LTIDQPDHSQTIDHNNPPDLGTLDHKFQSEKKKTEFSMDVPDANSLFDAMPLMSKNTKYLGGEEKSKRLHISN